MNLLEYEAKAIFSKHGIPTPPGRLVDSPVKARMVATQLQTPVVVKAQVAVAGRGKAGGILFADSPREAERAAEKLLSSRVKGIQPQNVLVEAEISIRQELYFAFTIDKSARRYVIVASSEGGVNIEELAIASPEKIIKVPIDLIHGFRAHHARLVARNLGYRGKQMLALGRIFYRLYEVALSYDAELAEMNPIVETSEGEFVAVDSRLIIDDNALYRHPKFRKLSSGAKKELTPQELEAQEEELAYVSLDGNIGVVGNGAGLVMATLDAIELYGGRSANFLDIGGGATADRITAALTLVFSNPHVKAVLINILGGITRCDEVAQGILKAKKRTGFPKPIVIRLVGTNEVEGKRMLTQAGLQVLDSMEEAAEEVVRISKSGG